jgi:voltage-gated potassium channel
VSQVPDSYGKPPAGLRRRMFDVIFEADTPAGRRFDIALVFVIMLSILVVVLDSVPGLHRDYGDTLNRVEWTFTVLFSIEYLARVPACSGPGATPPASTA